MSVGRPPFGADIGSSLVCRRCVPFPFPLDGTGALETAVF